MDEAPRQRMLVVDDEPKIRKTLARIFAASFEVVTCSSGQSAQTLLEQDDDFDIILCDMMMQPGTGAQLYEWLTQHRPAGSSSPKPIRTRSHLLPPDAFSLTAFIVIVLLMSNDYRPILEKNSGMPRTPGRRRNTAPAPGPYVARSSPPAVVTYRSA